MSRDSSSLDCPHRWLRRALWLPFGAWNILIWWGMRKRLKFNRSNLNRTKEEEGLKSPLKSHAQLPSHRMLEMITVLEIKSTSFLLKYKERTKGWNDRLKVTQIFGTELGVDLRHFAPQPAIPRHIAAFHQKSKSVFFYPHYYLLWALWQFLLVPLHQTHIYTSTFCTAPGSQEFFLPGHRPRQ